MNPEYAPSEYGLTRTEAKIYGMLAKSPSAVSRERIFWALYGDREDPPDEKIITVLISKARAKLRRHGVEIITRWGFGYELKRAA